MAISKPRKGEPLTAPEAAKEVQQLSIQSVTWGDLTWVNIEHPTAREMEYLAQNYPFNQLDLDDCLSRRQRPKLDAYKDYLFFIFLFSIYSRERQVSTHGQVSVFIGGKYCCASMEVGQLASGKNATTPPGKDIIKPN